MIRRVPSLNWLRVFEAAARHGSFARAAERLAMSPPAVSQQIRALESHLGRPLFTRAPAGVALTEAGRALLAVVGESLERMETAAAEIAAPRTPPLLIGVSLTLSIGWLAPRLPDFLSEHPETTLDMHALVGRPETPPRNAALWIAFGTPPPGVEATELFGERLVPVAHPDLARQIKTPEDLLNHRLIEVADHRRNWAQILGVEVIPARARLILVDNTMGALALAAARGGVALARSPASDAIVERYGLKRCVPDYAVRGIEAYSLLHMTAARLDAKAMAFKSWLKAEAQKTRNECQV